MTHRGAVPHLRLDRELVGARDCYDAWREVVSPVYEVTPLSDTSDGEESISAWLVGNLIFSDVAFSKQSFHHDHHHAENANYLSLQIYRSGSAKGMLEDSSWVMRPGEVHVFDFSREFHSVNEASSVAGVVIPHHAIGYDPARHPLHLTFSQNTAAGKFLSSAFFALMNLIPEFPTSETEVLVDGFCSLLQGMVAPVSFAERQVSKQRAQRRREIRSYLDRNLSDPDLDVDRVCQIFSMSRSSLYRDFAESGGVAQYLTARRLDRAFCQLRSGPSVTGYVKEVAERCGFTDYSHFSKIFRKRFGLSPRAVLSMNARHRIAAALHSQAGAEDAGRLNEWFEAI